MIFNYIAKNAISNACRMIMRATLTTLTYILPVLTRKEMGFTLLAVALDEYNHSC
ncbi:MAG: hypothetical protein QW128_01270 [Thermoprotei archaeon]